VAGGRHLRPAKGRGAKLALRHFAQLRAGGILRDENRFTSDEDAADQAAPMTENALAHLPETSALRRCLERLEPARRAVVVLSYVHGLSHGEMAGKLGVPLGTVKSWARRSLISLQECMG
jgi:RNA polymerase sigma-70 factor (ECF subfamily)